MKLNMMSAVVWARKNQPGAVSKKVELNAVDYDGELVFSATEPNQEKISFSPIVTLPIKKDDFTVLSDALFKRAVTLITRNSYKARENDKDTIICDLAFVNPSSDHVLRVLSYTKVNGNQKNRVCKLMVHKLNDKWADVSAANKVAAERRDGSSGYSKETCVFDMTLDIFPAVSGNWADTRDIVLFNDMSKKLDMMFTKGYSYGTFLDRVYESSQNGNGGNGNYNNQSQNQDNGNQSTSTEQVGTTANVVDEEFPF